MRRRSVLVIAMLAVGLTLCPAASKGQDAEAESAIRGVVGRLLTAFQKKDLDGVMSCWSAESPQLVAFRQSVRDDFAASDETQFSNVAFARWKVEGSQASVQVQYDRKWHDIKTNQTVQQRLFIYMMLVKEADGWKLSGHYTAGVLLAKALMAAETKEERTRLLADYKELVTTELVSGFLDGIERRRDKGLLDEALKLSDISLEVAAALGQSVDEGRCYLIRGLVYYKKVMYPDALASYGHALRLFQDAKDESWEAVALNEMAHAYEATGWHEEALNQYEASLKLARKNGDQQAVMNNLGNIGLIYKQMGKYPEALAANEAGRAAAHEANDLTMEIGFLLEIGMIHHSTGRYEEALNSFKLTLKLIKSDGGHREDELAALNDIGNVYRATGRYAEALEQFEAVARASHDAGGKAGEAIALHNIGITYALTGRYDEALRKYAESLQLGRAADDKALEARTLNSIGNLYQYTGRYEQALAKYAESLELKRAIYDRAGEATTLSNIGIVYHLMKRYEDAKRQFEAALKIMGDTGDELDVAKIFGNIAGINLEEGRYEEALAQLNKSLKTVGESGDWLSEATTLIGVGEAYRLQGKWREAADAYRKAIAVIELIRAETREPSLQTSFFAQHISPYYRLIEILLEHDSGGDEALALSERAKARTLVEVMAGGKVSIIKSMTDGERKREQEMKANVAAAQAQMDYALSGAPPDRRRVEGLRQQVDRARGDYEEFRRQLYIAHPELRVQRASFDPPTLTQLGRTLFAKNPGLCLLSYLVNKDETLLFVVKGGERADSPATLNVYTLKADGGEPLTADGIERRLGEFKQRYTHEDSAYKQAARELYESLLAPAEQDLKGASHVIIIPDGLLHTLPFQALVDRQGRHFIESHTVSYAPSIMALVQMMKLADRKKETGAASLPLLAMGRRAFPDQAQYRDFELHWAEEQVRLIAGMFGVRPLTGADATKKRAMSEMGNARYIHFATHGELDEAAPMYSAIVLGKSAGDDGMLYARELVDMNLQAELVVLSACNTGLGQTVNGEGILGLTWALFVAGAPTSVVTQWEVRDDSMTRLMVEFYRQMRLSTHNGRKQVSKAEALRQAQLSLLRTDVYKHPYYWAPVVLVGDWR